ncbi:hypothetical protein Lalb_Chr01g0016921 [Lupinus albus]|uniref:Uncharacterized protein n=1 Tax=Lupinus albus TaxID=3870 RepID=A0A6A4R6U6_LUPAL|nr:hypothetical protein Lalb_Chr01g0016921 [Lupinus albus]
MSFMVEIGMALIGLWGIFVRPMLFQCVIEMGETLKCVIYRIIIRGRPSWIHHNYPPYSIYAS